MLKFDDAVADIEAAVTAVVLGLFVHHAENALGAGNGGLNLAVELGQLVDGTGELLGIDDEGRDHADRDHPLQREPAAEGSHNDKGQVVDHVHHRPHGIADAVADDADAGKLVAGGVELGHGLVLQVIGGDGLAGGDLFLYDAVEAAEKLLTLKIVLPHRLGDDIGQHDREQHRHTGQQRQRNAVAQHHDNRADQRQHAREQGREAGRDDVRDVFRVVGHAAHHVAVRMAVQIGDRQRKHLAEEIGAQAIDDALRQPRREIALQQGGPAVQKIQKQHPAQNGRDGVKGRADQVVDGLALETRRQHAGDHPEHNGKREKNDIFPIRRKVRRKAGKRCFCFLRLFNRSP